MLFDETSIDDVDEVPRLVSFKTAKSFQGEDELPIEACVDKADEDFRHAIPILIDYHVGLTRRFGHVSRNPL